MKMSQQIGYIGGEYVTCDNDPFHLTDGGQMNHFFPENVNGKERYFFETASDAIAAIISKHSHDNQPIRFYFPENFCRATIQVILNKALVDRIEVRFYEDLSKISGEVQLTFVLLMHFNAVHNNSINSIQFPDHFILIEDFVQYPFHISSFKGDYAVNSLRKVMPLEVAIAYGKWDSYEGSRDSSAYLIRKKLAVGEKSAYLQAQKKEELCEIAYLKQFHEAEAALGEGKIFCAQAIEVQKLDEVDINSIIEKRRGNYLLLQELLAAVSEISVVEGDYMFLMLRLNQEDQRNELRKFMGATGIFTVIHWADAKTDFSKTALSIPIDQRYEASDMIRIALIIQEFYK